MRKFYGKPVRGGATLVEVAVGIAAVAAFVGLSMAVATGAAADASKMAACETRLSQLGVGVLSYAAEQGRAYPHRGLPTRDEAREKSLYLHPTLLTNGGKGYDMRPPLDGYVEVNSHLQCPLTKPIELFNTKADDNVSASYATWWGWRYDTDEDGLRPGMFKIGDRFGWKQESFRILAGDYDLDLGRFDGGGRQGSHPDEDDLLQPLAVQYQGLFGGKPGDANFLPISVSMWMRRGSNVRGLVDLNFLYDDGSVDRVDDIPHNEKERMSRVPNYFDGRHRAKSYLIPKR